MTSWRQHSDVTYDYRNRPVSRTINGTTTYTMMPVRMRGYWTAEELQNGDLLPSLPFTNGRPVMRFPRPLQSGGTAGPVLLYDLLEDPDQTTPIENPEVTTRLEALALQACRKCHAPEEMLIRYGLLAR